MVIFFWFYAIIHEILCMKVGPYYSTKGAFLKRYYQLYTLWVPPWFGTECCYLDFVA